MKSRLEAVSSVEFRIQRLYRVFQEMSTRIFNACGIFDVINKLTGFKISPHTLFEIIDAGSFSYIQWKWQKNISRVS